MIALDEAGDILHANRAAGELLGGQGSPLWQQIVSALRSGSSDTMRLQNGEHALLVTMNPLPGDGDQARGAVAMILDITEQERLERTRREYVANISHELRTPLTSMRGIAEALRDGLVTGEEEKQRYYATIVA